MNFKMTLAIFIFLALTGCVGDFFSRELKCIDGKVFIKQGGIWIQSAMYMGCASDKTNEK